MDKRIKVEILDKLLVPIQLVYEAESVEMLVSMAGSV